MTWEYDGRPEGFTEVDEGVLADYLDYELAAQTLFDKIADHQGLHRSSRNNNSLIIYPSGLSAREVSKQFKPVEVSYLDIEGSRRESWLGLFSKTLISRFPSQGVEAIQRKDNMFVANPEGEVEDKITRPSTIMWAVGDLTIDGPYFANESEVLNLLDDPASALEQDRYIGYLQRTLGALASSASPGESSSGNL